MTRKVANEKPEGFSDFYFAVMTKVEESKKHGQVKRNENCTSGVIWQGS